MLSCANAGVRRIFASLLGLCLDQSRLGQSSEVCSGVACWHVYSARGEDVRAIAGLDRDNMDDWLGFAWLYFCPLRNVETSSRSDGEPKSARPEITGTFHGFL